MDRNATDINAELLAVQESWARRLYSRLINEYEKNEEEKGKLSCAFSFGVSERYVQSDKKIMIVGQEANGHTFDYKNWGLESWQKWAVDYLNFQVYGDKSKKWSFSNNNSPFWQFITKLERKGYGVCWNNLDKVRRYISNNGPELTEDYLLEFSDEDKIKDRSILHEKIFDANSKSLLQKEIAIAEPDIVVFAVGPKNPYYHSLSLAFFDGKEVDSHLNVKGKLYPQLKNGNYCCNISKALNLSIPVYYTYHPKYLSLKKILVDVVNRITNESN